MSSRDEARLALTRPILAPYAAGEQDAMFLLSGLAALAGQLTELAVVESMWPTPGLQPADVLTKAVARLAAGLDD